MSSWWFLQEFCRAAAVSSIGNTMCTRSGTYVVCHFGFGSFSATGSEYNFQGSCLAGDLFDWAMEQFPEVFCVLFTYTRFPCDGHVANAKKLCLGCGSRGMIESGLRAKLITLWHIICDHCFSGVGLSLFAGKLQDIFKNLFLILGYNIWPGWNLGFHTY